MKRQCPHCHSTEYRRINREGWLQREFLPRWFGLYPWECVLCRRRKFLRDDGHRPRPSTVPTGNN